MSDMFFKDLKMEGFPTTEKRNRVYAVASKLAAYTASVFDNSINGGVYRRLFVAPIDHGGAVSWNYLKKPVTSACKKYGIEVVVGPEDGMEQKPGYDDHLEYRPITTEADSFADRETGAILMLDSSASEDAASGKKKIGPSIMGGVVWACENLRKFGDDGKGVIIMSGVIRDYCPAGIANFSCYSASRRWIGPKKQLENMEHACGRFGEGEDSPINAIQEYHYTPKGFKIPIPILGIDPTRRGLSPLFGSRMTSILEGG